MIPSLSFGRQRAARFDQVHCLADRVGTDENRDIELVEPVDQREQRLQIADLDDLDHRKQDRVAARGADQLGQVRGLVRGARHHDTAPCKRSSLCFAHRKIQTKGTTDEHR